MVTPLPVDVVADAILASSPLATIVLDEARVVVAFNPAAEVLTGRAVGEVLGESAATLFPAADATRSLMTLEAAARGETGRHIETQLRTGSGGVVAVGISWAPLVHEGRTCGLVGVGRDIARRKRLEHELRRMAESFRAIAEGSDLGMYRFSFLPDLRVDYVNPELVSMIGVTHAELLSDPAPLWQRLDAHARASLDDGRRGGQVAWPLDATWRHPDGHVLELQFHEIALRDVAGRLEGVLGVVRDVTRQRQQERATASALELERAAADRLRRVDELRKVFLRAVSHELRTPLTAVLGFAATLRDRVGDLPPDRAAALADRLHVQATRIQRLLDDLLDVDRLSRGALLLDRTTVDLGALVHQVVADIDDPRVAVVAPPCTARVDPPKIERIVVNLVTNARRHAGPMAAIRVSLACGPPLVLAVDDDGPGVPEHQRTVVFEPFTQGSAAVGAASPGTGIGLTLVSAFTELHGGRVHVERSDLGGARFVVELPMA